MTQSNSPIDIHRESVRAEWVDYNGHMNVAYFVLVFDHATDTLFDHVGLDESYRAETNNSVFVVEAHVTYDQEVLEGAALRVTTQILDIDDKRLHLFHRMYAGDSDDLLATNELMILHMDMDIRRSAPFPKKALTCFQRLAKEHQALGRPGQSGREIGIRRRGDDAPPGV